MTYKEKVQMLRELLFKRYGKGELFIDSLPDYDNVVIRWGKKVISTGTDSLEKMVDGAIDTLK